MSINIEELKNNVAALRQDAVARLAEIQNEVNALLTEGQSIADAAGVQFSLSSTVIAGQYGMGGLRYVPEDIAEESYYGDKKVGWLSSSSDDC